MLKLYYSAGACSLSPHIVLREAGLDFALVRVHIPTHQLDGGADFYSINPLGYVPVLELGDGSRLRESIAIVSYIADQAPQKQLLPSSGMPKYRCLEWMTFLSTELHKGGFSPLFGAWPDEVKSQVRDRLLKRLAWVDGELAGKTYLLGAEEAYCVADVYLFVILRWSTLVGLDLTPFSHLNSHSAKVAARPATQAALAAEFPKMG